MKPDSLWAIVIVLSSLLLLAGGALYLLIRQPSIPDRISEKLQPILSLVFVITLLVSSGQSLWTFADRFLPVPASKHGGWVKPLFDTTTILTGITFVFTHILLFFFLFRYRNRPGRQARYQTGNIRLELTWIIIPSAVFLFLFVWGQILWNRIQTPPPENEALRIDVMGQQFSWKVRYPGPDQKLGRTAFHLLSEKNTMGIDPADSSSHDDFIPVQMHIPKGRAVQLVLRSNDVIHSFFIPHMRVKMDALPGMTTTTHFTATYTTREMRRLLNDPEFNYEVACAELCGRMHFAMKMILVVEEPDEFEEWRNNQETWYSRNVESFELANAE